MWMRKNVVASIPPTPPKEGNRMLRIFTGLN